MTRLSRYPCISFLAGTAVVLLATGSIASGQTRGSGAEIFRILRGSTIGVEVRDAAPGGKAGAELGAVVERVQPDRPADKAGVKAGDIIVEFDGERVRSAASLSRLVNETPAGRAAKMAVLRDGKRVDLTVTFDADADADQALSFALPNLEGRRWTIPLDREPDVQVMPRQPREFREPGEPLVPRFAPPLWRFDGSGRLGIGVQELTPQLGEYFGAKQGVLVSSVEAGTAAEKAGLKAGDVITAVDGRAVGSGAELRRRLGEKGEGDQVALAVTRDRKSITLKATIERPRARAIVRPV